MASIEEKVENLVRPKIEEIGYRLYDVQYLKEGKDYFLRIFIDKDDGIDLSDCEKVSNQINSILDEEDYIKEQYFLEVSSPGIERILRKDKHLKEATDKKVIINLFRPINGKKEYVGILDSFNDEFICIKLVEDSDSSDKELKIDRKDISLIKLKYDWD